jgi:hypothetical protein
MQVPGLPERPLLLCALKSLLRGNSEAPTVTVPLRWKERKEKEGYIRNKNWDKRSTR